MLWITLIFWSIVVLRQYYICHNWRYLSESTCFIPIFFIFDNSVSKKKSRIKSASVDQLNIQGKLSRSDSELHAAQTKTGSINRRPEVTWILEGISVAIIRLLSDSIYKKK